jgi:hypothetical protein
MTSRRRTQFWADLAAPVQLTHLCLSVSPPAVARPTSLLLALQVPGQGLAYDSGFLEECAIQPMEECPIQPMEECLI